MKDTTINFKNDDEFMSPISNRELFYKDLGKIQNRFLKQAIRCADRFGIKLEAQIVFSLSKESPLKKEEIA